MALPDTDWRLFSKCYMLQHHVPWAQTSIKCRIYPVDIFRFVYTSLTTPRSVYDFNMSTKERILLKQKKVLGGEFDSNKVNEAFGVVNNNNNEMDDFR